MLGKNYSYSETSYGYNAASATRSVNYKPYRVNNAGWCKNGTTYVLSNINKLSKKKL